MLILDEPTTGLDEAGARRTMALLRGLMAGRTTILITHDLRLVDGADQALVLGETMPGRWSVPSAPLPRLATAPAPRAGGAGGWPR